MSTSTQRIATAFAHQPPDRTPLFEIFSPYHPIYWDLCGHTIATDMAMAWDAMADGAAYEELLQAHIQAQYTLCRFFGLDMVRLNGVPGPDYPRPRKTGEKSWTLGGTEYHLDPRTCQVVLAAPQESSGYSHRFSEEQAIQQLADWDGAIPAWTAADDPVLAGIQKLASAEGLDWVYMGEIGAGTGVAFYPPFLLMWIVEKPELFQRWLEMQKHPAFARTRQLVRQGCTVIAMGGDVSCDKGPFISPAHYRQFILPVIQEHVELIHSLGAQAVYTSDGNHWPIKHDFFFASGIDGYKEVDQAAGMTWPRLIQEGVADKICIVGNLDARFTLCRGTVEQVRAEVFACLKYGRQASGGHILHASHSVHEDVRVENYWGAIAAYREFFGLEKLAL